MVRSIAMLLVAIALLGNESMTHAESVDKMTPQNSILMLSWIDIWIGNIENFLRREVTGDHVARFLQSGSSIDSVGSGERRRMVKDSLISLQTARMRIKVKIIPSLRSIVNTQSKLSPKKATELKKDNIREVKLIAELEALSDNVKQASAKLINLIQFLGENCAVNCNIKELAWSRDMLNNKLMKQIESIRVAFMDSLQ